MQPRNEFNTLQRLQIAYYPRHNAQHARFLTAPHHLWRRRLRIQAPIARAVWAEVVDAELAVELHRGAADEGLVEDDGGVGEEVPCRRVVGAVEDQVVRGEDGARVLGRERGRVGGYGYGGVYSAAFFLNDFC